MKGGFIGALAGVARVGATAARVGSVAARAGSAGSKVARAGSVAGRAGTTGTRTFSAAGRTLSKPTTSGFKPPSAPAKPPSAPAKPPSAPAKPPSAPAKPPSAPAKPPSAPAKPPSAQPTGQSGYSGSSYADHFGTAASFAPGYGQQGSYGSMGLASTGMGLATTGMGLAGTSIGAFTQAASEGTSQEALGEASRRGTEKGKKAADIVESTIVSGKTSGPVIKHHKNRCPCPSNIRKYSRVQQGLPKGLQSLIAQYYTVASRCKCQGDNEELGKYLLKKILKSKHLLMSSGHPFSRTALYKHIAKEAAAPAAGGTRKKIRSVIHKKSKTRKQQKTQLRQSRRRTRKN